ncbi:MAG: metal ABC transporter permease [Cyanobacteria bacterium J06642_2]
MKADSAMSLTLVGFFAIGVALLSVLDSRLGLEELLFGSILSVSLSEVWLTGIVAAIALGCVAAFYKELLFFSVNRRGAEAAGLPVRVINMGFVAGVALAVMMGMQVVGVILVILLLVGPLLTAYLLVKELHWMIAIGTLLGVLSSVMGMYLSFHFNIPPGSAIEIVVFALFLLVPFVLPHRRIKRL